MHLLKIIKAINQIRMNKEWFEEVSKQSEHCLNVLNSYPFVILLPLLKIEIKSVEPCFDNFASGI